MIYQGRLALEYLANGKNVFFFKSNGSNAEVAELQVYITFWLKILVYFGLQISFLKLNYQKKFLIV